MGHLDEETSNALFTTLAEWNQVLEDEALKGWLVADTTSLDSGVFLGLTHHS